MGKIVNRGVDGIIYVLYTPQMTDNDADIYIAELTALVKASKEKVRVLTDVGPLVEIRSEYLKNCIAQGIKPLKPMIEKSAVIGMDTMKRIAARIILTLSGRHDIRLFATREEAMDWLRAR